MNSVCSKCGKPVYFAERKTSLGKNWHPACLKCEECGKVLTPGQHAEHKGRPYCHRPCYAALFGPRMMGYGSNVCSPANFRKSGEGTLHNGDAASDSPKMIYEWGGNGGINDSKSSPVMRRTKTPNGTSSSSPVPTPGTSNNGASSQNGRANGNVVQYQQYDSETQELLQKIKDFNKYYEGKKRQSLSANSDNTSGDLVIQGPLRIYWGVSKPIQLQQFDDVPSNVSEANWRHSFVPGSHDQPADQQVPDIASLRLGEPKSPVLNKGFDDSIIQTPPDGVVLRRKNIKKFNTVAYRGDSRPNKWKRASINGHIYNFDTRVFTPVVGSCTSVTVNSTNTTAEIIKILLEKFKIENQPDEYSLYLVSDVGGEKLLKDSDYPLLERVALGPDELSGAKIYLRDKVLTPLKYSNVQIAVPEVVVEEEETKTESPTTTVPDEVEALIAIPEPVLRGILQKFSADEEGEVKKIKARYEVAKRKIRDEISKIKTKM